MVRTHDIALRVAFCAICYELNSAPHFRSHIVTSRLEFREGVEWITTVMRIHRIRVEQIMEDYFLGRERYQNTPRTKSGPLNTRISKIHMAVSQNNGRRSMRFSRRTDR